MLAAFCVTHHRIRGRLAKIQPLLTNIVLSLARTLCGDNTIGASTCDTTYKVLRTKFESDTESQAFLPALPLFGNPRKELGHSGLFMLAGTIHMSYFT